MFSPKLVEAINCALFHGLLKKVIDQKKTALNLNSEKLIKDMIIYIAEILGNVMTSSYKNLPVFLLFSVTKLAEHFCLSALPLLIKHLV